MPAPINFVASSIDTEKELNSIKGEDMKIAILNKYHVGDRFKLDSDPRGGGSLTGGTKAYKPGEYTIIGLYPLYVLCERRDANDIDENGDDLGIKETYVSKESFTYSDMYRILKGTYDFIKARNNAYPEEETE